MTAVFTDDPALVAGCVDCLELAAEDLVQDNEHWANCLHCRQEISAQSGVEWRRTGGIPGPAVATTHNDREVKDRLRSPHFLCDTTSSM